MFIPNQDQEQKHSIFDEITIIINIGFEKLSQTIDKDTIEQQRMCGQVEITTLNFLRYRLRSPFSMYSITMKGISL